MKVKNDVLLAVGKDIGVLYRKEYPAIVAKIMLDNLTATETARIAAAKDFEGLESEEEKKDFLAGESEVGIRPIYLEALGAASMSPEMLQRVHFLFG